MSNRIIENRIWKLKIENWKRRTEGTKWKLKRENRETKAVSLFPFLKKGGGSYYKLSVDICYYYENLL